MFSEEAFKTLCATIGTMSEEEFEQLFETIVAEMHELAMARTLAEVKDLKASPKK